MDKNEFEHESDKPNVEGQDLNHDEQQNLNEPPAWTNMEIPDEAYLNDFDPEEQDADVLIPDLGGTVNDSNPVDDLPTSTPRDEVMDALLKSREDKSTKVDAGEGVEEDDVVEAVVGEIVEGTQSAKEAQSFDQEVIEIIEQEIVEEVEIKQTVGADFGHNHAAGSKQVELEEAIELDDYVEFETSSIPENPQNPNSARQDFSTEETEAVHQESIDGLNVSDLASSAVKMTPEGIAAAAAIEAGKVASQQFQSQQFGQQPPTQPENMPHTSYIPKFEGGDVTLRRPIFPSLRGMFSRDRRGSGKQQEHLVGDLNAHFVKSAINELNAYEKSCYEVSEKTASLVTDLKDNPDVNFESTLTGIKTDFAGLDRDRVRLERITSSNPELKVQLDGINDSFAERMEENADQVQQLTGDTSLSEIVQNFVAAIKEFIQKTLKKFTRNTQTEQSPMMG